MSIDELEALLGLPDEILVGFSYSVVDATLMHFLDAFREQNKYTYRFRRVSITTGSCRYIISLHSGKDSIGLGEMAVRMMTPGLTAVTVIRESVHPDPIGADGVLRHFLRRFSEWLAFEQQYTHSFAANEGLIQAYPEADFQTFAQNIDDRLERIETLQTAATPKAEPKARGRPTKNYNIWARQQIEQGRNQTVVFKEYMQQVLKDDPHAEEIQIRERFRKAIANTKKAKSGRK